MEGNGMKTKEKIIIGKIYYIASDKRNRVLKDDHIDWLEEKLKEIKKLSKSLPKIDYKP
jgi:hypothetical protein